MSIDRHKFNKLTTSFGKEIPRPCEILQSNFIDNIVELSPIIIWNRKKDLETDR